MIDVNDFFELTEEKSPLVSVKFGKIPSTYTSGRPTVLLDGATVPTIRKYPYIGTYKPTAGHRVMIIQGVVMGNIV